MNTLHIYGAGAGGHIVSETAKQTPEWISVVFVDDSRPPSILGNGDRIISYASFAEMLKNSTDLLPLFIAIADNKRRLELFNKIENCLMVNIIHPSVTCAGVEYLGSGVHIKQGAQIGREANIGNACIIDTGAIMCHDSWLGDGVHVGPGAMIGSNVIIGKGTLIGQGANIPTGTKIGENCIIAPGAVILHNIPSNSIVSGNPARIMGRAK